MRFVDGHEADAARREHREKAVAAVAHEAFGRDVEQAIASVSQPRHDGRFFIGRERAVVEAGWNAVADERVDLIFHQRNQWRDDEGDAVANEGRRLKAE